MADLGTTYMGLELKNPFIVGASTLTSDINTLKNLQSKGAAAVVIRSLFEEQIENEAELLDEELTMYDDKYAEHSDMMPTLRFGGPRRHLFWVKKAVTELEIPVIASLNALDLGTWVEYAKLLEETGVAGIELNLYSTVEDPDRDAEQIELEHLRILESVREEVEVPISAKLSYFYTNPLNFIKSVDGLVDGIVLFNRFMQPSIDVNTFKAEYRYNLSNPGDHKIELRYTGLISSALRSDVCASGGIHSGADAVKMVLAGASTVQTVSALYKNGAGHLLAMIDEFNGWMDSKGYSRVQDFKGMLSKERNPDPEAFTRAQYVQALRMLPDYLKKEGGAVMWPDPARKR